MLCSKMGNPITLWWYFLHLSHIKLLTGELAQDGRALALHARGTGIDTQILQLKSTSELLPIKPNLVLLALAKQCPHDVYV